MITDINLNHPIIEIKFREATNVLNTLKQKELIDTENNLPEILFITSFPPRECGIATYSQDLVNSLNNQFETSFKCTICALESDTEQHTYKQPPKFILNTDYRSSYIKTALSINREKSIKLVVVQHEFGFFDKKEMEFHLLLELISKPIALVFHTVLPRPSEELRTKVYCMTAVTSSVIVMTNDAASILKNEYHVASSKINVIPHGTHLVPPIDQEKLKTKYHLNDKKVLSTFGLLSSSKSIETTLRALPAIAKAIPNVLFLVLGKTHPSVVKQEGEQYRKMLEQIVKELNIEKHVRFVNEYLPLPKLLEYLQLTDIYLFTSKDPNQAVSGTFSYAVSCGCPVISTPIPHAKEVLSNNNGILFDFGNSSQLSEAVISLFANEKLRSEISSNGLKKMASTAWQNSGISHALLFETLTSNAFQLNYKIPKINLNHIKKMTTDFGMIQFSQIANPDIHSGFTLDDNARALIAICQHYELFREEDDLKLMNIYLQFIKHCLLPNGKFFNYVNEQKEFSPQNKKENLEDSNGRAIWALGYLSYLKGILPDNLINEAENILEQAIPHLDKIYSTRAMAFIIKGLYYQNKDENFALLKTFANRLNQMYKHEMTNEWHWFENYLTYGNSLLPEAMLCAYLISNDIEYKKIAVVSFDFLLSKLFVNGKFKVISNNGWLVKDKLQENQAGGEQPIDVAYTIMALERFYYVFRKDEYKQNARTIFNWFLGDNHLHEIVYNPITGGCYDGIEAHNVNLNQGAESSLSYLMARLAIQRILILEKESPIEGVTGFHGDIKE